MVQLITLRQLAEELNIDRSNLRRYILKKGITFKRIRTEAGRHQLEIALTSKDADKIREIRDKEGFFNIKKR